MHISDICNAIDRSAIYLFKSHKKFQIINIGSSSRNTNMEILQKIEKITKVKSLYNIVDRRKGDVDLLICSNTKAKKILNWNTRLNVKQATNLTIEWYKEFYKSKKNNSIIQLTKNQILQYHGKFKL